MPEYRRSYRPGGTFFFYDRDPGSAAAASGTDQRPAPARCPANGNERAPFRFDRRRHFARSPPLHLDVARERQRLFVAHRADESTIHAIVANRSHEPGGSRRQKRGRLAAAVLGAHHSRWKRLGTPRQLSPLQSRQAWFGPLPAFLAGIVVRCLGEARCIRAELVLPMRRRRCAISISTGNGPNGGR